MSEMSKAEIQTPLQRVTRRINNSRGQLGSGASDARQLRETALPVKVLRQVSGYTSSERGAERRFRNCVLFSLADV